MARKNAGILVLMSLAAMRFCFCIVKPGGVSRPFLGMATHLVEPSFLLKDEPQASTMAPHHIGFRVPLLGLIQF